MSHPETSLPVDSPTLAELTRAELIELIEAQQEAGIRISFPGKSNARKTGRRVRPRTLRELKSYGAGSEPERAHNLVIEGDNLQSLATLYKDRGQVDLIIADPPYNTGRDFRYNDRWDDDPNDPGLGEYVASDDGARHTKWMKFMWPRLQMMKSMLKPGGVIAVCIDYRELFRLGQMLDELFMEQNRLAIINWQKSYAPRNDKNHVSAATEYILVYAKDEARATTALLPRTPEMDARYRSPDGDPRIWKPKDASGSKAAKNQTMVYAIQSPFTGELHYPQAGSCWRTAQRQLLTWITQWGADYELRDLDDAVERAKIIGIAPSDVPPVMGIVLKTPLGKASAAARKRLEAGHWPQLFFGQKGTGRPALKSYLEDVKQGRVPTTFWADEDYTQPIVLGTTSWAHTESGHSQTGIGELDAIVGPHHGFDTVKPLKLIEKVINLWCPPDGIVLDPFAGSGTTGHAVLRLNAETGSERRFTLIEQGRPDRGDSYARSLLADRLKRVISGKWRSQTVDPQPGGFRFAALDRKVDAAALLSMERGEMTDTVIASHFDSNRRRGPGLSYEAPAKYRYLVARNADDEGFFLVWDGPNENTNLTEDVYEDIVAEATDANLKPIYHVYARLFLFQTDDVIFYQIPDRILRDFGLDLRGEPFSEE
ncbi:site-specific DNA-methyltransferase [Streptomyces blattellae]|uniref:site-specific DNA-methyltransferase n=1 Tax=Streptomyces blattellae TaxID=2569855 RepID=UPI0012B8FD9E|nr:site-specific DNA-methyltransferase [Streptomyces blattellae]